MNKRSRGVVDGFRAAAAGLDFARDGWRRAWAPLTLAALGQAAVFSAGRAELAPAAAQALGWSGAALYLISLGPKLGALHRAAAGAPPARRSRGGLGWEPIEARITATAIALVGLALVTISVCAAVWVVLLALAQPRGVVRLGALGSWAVGFLLLAPVIAASLAVVVVGFGRMMLTLPAEVAEAQPRFARGWELTRGPGGAPAAWVALLTCIGPSLGLLALQAGLDAIAGVGRWPLMDAVMAGAGLAALTQFLAAPANAGALAWLYRRAQAQGAAGVAAGPAVAPPGVGETAAPEPSRA